MIVGLCPCDTSSRDVSDDHNLGAAIGNLGRHTPIDSTGMPIFDHRAEVFLIVSYPPIHRVVKLDANRLLDHICLAIDADIDLRFHETGGAFSL